MPSCPVRIPRELHSRLQLPIWNGLDESERLEIVSQLSECISANGRLLEPIGFREFGPDDGRPQIVFQFKDCTFDISYSLVPGGSFEPGYGARLLEKLLALIQKYEPWAIDFDPAAATAWSCKQPCDLRRKPLQRVDPFLMATTRVTSGQWAEIEPVLRRHAWELPTSFEFEWAVRGGVDSLFYWGNSVPYFMTCFLDRSRSDFDAKDAWSEKETAWVTSFDGIMHGEFRPNSARSWPWCNRFGLHYMVSWSTWCAPVGDMSDPYPLVSRGGARGGYPWQGCGEWRWLLSAFERRISLTDDYANRAWIRPIIRLVPADG
jgi:hypothetical protein